MRTVLTVLALVISGSVSAATVTALPNVPPPAGLINVHWTHCSANAFDVDGLSINGVCQYSYGSAPRFHPSATVLYRVKWDHAGNFTGLGAQCAYTTTQPLYVGDGCRVDYSATGTLLTIDGVPYYYVATTAVTGDELVNSNAQSFLALGATMSPAGFPLVVMRSEPGGALLSWSTIPAATSYEVVRGSLSALRSSSGSFTSATDVCLANNPAGSSIQDVAMPPSGDAFWYLVRPVNSVGPGTYDTGSPSQVASRDDGIQASPHSCP